MVSVIIFSTLSYIYILSEYTTLKPFTVDQDFSVPYSYYSFIEADTSNPNAQQLVFYFDYNQEVYTLKATLTPDSDMIEWEVRMLGIPDGTNWLNSY